MAFDSKIIPGSAAANVERKNLPFGQTSEEYAAVLAEQRRQERLAKVLQAQKEARLAREAGQVIPGPTFTSPTPNQRPTSTQQGPVQTGPAKFKNSPIITVGRHMPSTIALWLVLAWYPFQFSLFMMSIGLFSSGVLAMFAATPIVKVAEWLGYDLAPYMGILLAGGIGVGVLNATLTLSVLVIVLFIYKFSGTHALGGAENTITHKYVLFGVAIIGYLLFPLAPWAIPWINYVKINPE